MTLCPSLNLQWSTLNSAISPPDAQEIALLLLATDATMSKYIPEILIGEGDEVKCMAVKLLVLIVICVLELPAPIIYNGLLTVSILLQVTEPAGIFTVSPAEAQVFTQ
jgi:hypothetical protein